MVHAGTRKQQVEPEREERLVKAVRLIKAIPTFPTTSGSLGSRSHESTGTVLKSPRAESPVGGPGNAFRLLPVNDCFSRGGF